MPQPFLHDLVCAVRAPALAVSGVDGQIRAEGVHGIYVSDRRIISRAVLTIDGAEPTSLQGNPVGGDAALFVSTVQTLGDQFADPTVLVRRTRTTVPDGAAEQVEVVSYARSPVQATLSLHADCDLADMAAVRSGESATALPPAPERARAELERRRRHACAGTSRRRTGCRAPGRRGNWTGRSALRPAPSSGSN